MSNIQKAFKRKAEKASKPSLRSAVNMATGGVLDEAAGYSRQNDPLVKGDLERGAAYQFGRTSPDGYGAQHQFASTSMADMSRLASAGRGMRSILAANPGMSNMDADNLASAGYGMRRTMAGAMGYNPGAKQDPLDRLFMAEGGVVKDGTTPTADDVPVNLSRGEAVLPHKTVKAMGGPEAVEELIEHTNGKPPVTKGLRAGGNYAAGLIDPLPGAAPTEEELALAAKNGDVPQPKAIDNLTAGRTPQFGNQAATSNLAPLNGGTTRAGDYPSAASRLLTGAQATLAAPNAAGLTPVVPAAASAAAAEPKLTKNQAANAKIMSEGYDATGKVDLPAIDGAKVKQATAAAKSNVLDAAEGGDLTSELALKRAGVDQRTERMNSLAKGALGAVPDGLTQRYGPGDSNRAYEFTSGKDVAAGNPNVQDGTGVVSIRQPNGSFKNVLLDSPQYTAADGSKTSDWTKTSQYAQGVAQAAKDKATLADLEKSNLRRSALIAIEKSDPAHRAKNMAEFQKNEAATNATAAKNAADAAYHQATLRQTALRDAALAQHYQNLDANSKVQAELEARKKIADEMKDRRKQVNESIETYAAGDKGVQAAARAYADRNIKDDGKRGAGEIAAAAKDQGELDAALGAAGQHWFTPEKGWDGETAMYEQAPLTFGDLFRLGRGKKYEDKESGRVIYDSDLNALSPRLRQAWAARQEDIKARKTSLKDAAKN